MSFRVYDTKEKCWVNENVCLGLDDELYLIEKRKLGGKFLKLLSSKRYVYHKDIGLADKCGILIYEGEIVEVELSEDEFSNMKVAYSPELASYILLDYKTDKILRKTINKELKGTTSLIVAQRIGTIKNADKIIVLDKGNMVGIGKHEELLKNNAIYREVYESQVKGGDDE